MKKFLALAGLSALALGFLVIPSTSEAFGGRTGRGQGSNYDPARHEAMVKVLENRDFDGWKSLLAEMPNRGQRILEVVTEQNFDKFAEAKLLMNKGRLMLNDLGLSRGWAKNAPASQ